MYSTEAWGKLSKEANFSKFQIQRNVPGDDDYVVKTRNAKLRS